MLKVTPLYFGIFGLSLLLSFVLTRSIRSFCTSRGVVRPPDPDRDVHVIPLPRLGGVAIYISFMLSMGIAMLVTLGLPGVVPGLSRRTLLTILFAGTLILALGIWGDIRSLSRYTKFGVQGVAAAILFAGGMRILDLPIFFGTHHFGWLVGLPITMLWVIGITNAFNLIDGLDGLAAGSALFSTLVVFSVALYSQAALVTLLTIALAGAILGFLRFNFNPATILLGDCGSMFIGFMLSALALQGAQKSPTAIAVAIPVVSLGLPILDTVLSVLRRCIGGKPLLVADREHIHHKLLERGLSHRQVVILLYAVSALFAVLSLFLLLPSGATLGLVLVVVGTGVWFGVQQLGYLEFHEIQRLAQRTVDQRRILLNNLSFRRATEELKNAPDYAELCRIVEAAFSTNDFDGFDLEVMLLPEGDVSHSLVMSGLAETTHHEWTKLSSIPLHSLSAWSLTLQLITTTNRRRGSLKIHRLYNQRPLLVDINFLTSVFPTILANALDRTLSSSRELSDTALKKVDGLGRVG